MLATFGLERLESKLNRDTLQAVDVAEFLERAQPSDVEALARDGMGEALDCFHRRQMERIEPSMEAVMEAANSSALHARKHVRADARLQARLQAEIDAGMVTTGHRGRAARAQALAAAGTVGNGHGGTVSNGHGGTVGNRHGETVAD